MASKPRVGGSIPSGRAICLWQADERAGHLAGRRDNGGGAVERVVSDGDRLARGALSHRHIAAFVPLMEPGPVGPSRNGLPAGAAIAAPRGP